MDLLAIWRTTWKHKLALLPLILLTLAGAAYVTFLVPAVYEAQASLVLVAPPTPPTEREIEEDPSLRDVNANNPYRDLDTSVVISIVAQRLTTKESREMMVLRGADDRYEVAPSARYGFVSPILDITGVGDSVEEAVATAILVGDAVEDELRQLQEAQGVDATYMITTLPVTVPVDAEHRVSSKLRSLIAVLGLGGVLSFALLSLLQARDRLVEERARKSPSSPPIGRAGEHAAGRERPADDNGMTWYGLTYEAPSLSDRLRRSRRQTGTVQERGPGSGPLPSAAEILRGPQTTPSVQHKQTRDPFARERPVSLDHTETSPERSAPPGPPKTVGRRDAPLHEGPGAAPGPLRAHDDLVQESAS